MNTISLHEQTTALVTMARGSDDPEPVLTLLGTYYLDQPDAAAGMDLLLALVASLAYQHGQALDLLDAIAAAQRDEDTP